MTVLNSITTHHRLSSALHLVRTLPLPPTSLRRSLISPTALTLALCHVLFVIFLSTYPPFWYPRRCTRKRWTLANICLCFSYTTSGILAFGCSQAMGNSPCTSRWWILAVIVMTLSTTVGRSLHMKMASFQINKNYNSNNSNNILRLQ